MFKYFHIQVLNFVFILLTWCFHLLSHFYSFTIYYYVLGVYGIRAMGMDIGFVLDNKSIERHKKDYSFIHLGMVQIVAKPLV